MKTKELFLKDPLSWTLANEGVSSNNDADEATLRYELETFVCEGEYESALEKILTGYLSRLGGGEQAGAWISGFYGSGKSHLVKVLRYLWTDYQFADGTKAREICKLPPTIVESLKELSTRGKQHGGLHSAGGTLKAGTGDVRMRVLQIVFKSVGLPTKHSPANFIMDLRRDGNLAKLEKILKGQGKDPLIEADRLYTSKALHEAYLELYPHHDSVANVGKALQAQYPAKVENIHVDEMIAVIRRAIERDGKLPCTVLVLDEIQQYINNNPDVANEVQEVVEACQKRLDGMLTIVGTGQSALSDTPALQRIMGRFPIKSHLKDNDVDKVVRTVVLQKDPKHKKTLQKLVGDCSGEITRQLNNTKIATLPEDQNEYAPDFPLLPVRRRFWKHVLHHTDTTGTTAQMRTQLRVTHEACRSVADRDVGTVVPADFIYDQLASDLLSSGELQKRFQEIIEEQRSKAHGDLRRRICATVFLINKLPDAEGDLGIRADAAHLADLLTDSLTEGTDEIRKRVPLLLAALHEEGVLMEVDGEYRLQTTEGAAWEGEYRKLLASIKNDEARIAAERSQLISKEISTALGGITVSQGTANVARKTQMHYGKEKPPAHDGPVIWIRDGFSESESSIIKEVNGAPTEDATVFVVISKAQVEELKGAIAASLAAEEKLGVRKLFTAAGLKFSPGQEALDAPRFVVLLKELAASAGGPPPAPEPPKSPLLTELEGLQGNDLLFRLFEESATLTTNIATWKKTGHQIAQRTPVFQKAEQLLRHGIAAALPGMARCQADWEAVRDHRSLLDEPDPVSPVLQTVSTALRNGLREGHSRCEQVLQEEIAALEKHSLWGTLAADKRNALLSSRGVVSHPVPQLSSEAEILASLQACDIAGWKTRADALSTRCAAALAEAIKEAKPKARRISLPSATIETAAELEAWLGQVRETIEKALRDGPAIL